MPLKHGTSQRTLIQNYAKEKAAGKPESQAWATAFTQQRRARMARAAHARRPRRSRSND